MGWVHLEGYRLGCARDQPEEAWTDAVEMERRGRRESREDIVWVACAELRQRLLLS